MLAMDMSEQELQSVYQAAAEAFELNADELRHSRMKDFNLCLARFAITAYLRSQYRYSYTQLCRLQNLSSHKSINYRITAYDNLMDTDWRYRATVKEFVRRATTARRVKEKQQKNK